MGADLFVFTEQRGFPVKACSLPSHPLLRRSLEIRGDHAVAPKARNVSRIPPKCHVSPAMQPSAEPAGPRSDAPQELGAPAAPRGGMCNSPQGRWEWGWR